jgi:tRNA A-37 threonylcarbamoyl transferase component Bud32
MDVYIHQKKVRLSARQLIGQGGEAEVYRLPPDTAVKLFKPPSHGDFSHQPQAQQAAQQRLEQHQQKLREFPQNLPPRVVAPQSLVSDRAGQQILGYTMPLLGQADLLLRYSQRSFRQTIPTQVVIDIFRDLHQTLTQIHKAQVVIGDFNDLNVLVQGRAAYLIDADSFQFGSFPCQMFTARFVDPLRCDPRAAQLQLQQPHTPDSDWYAFTVMLMQCLLFVDPYGGIYKPRHADRAVPQAARPLHRITVFHPEVRYPKPALPYHYLPDALLHHFHQVFEQDWRGPFPQTLLETLPWTTCPQCGLDHAHRQCPRCAKPHLTPVATPGQVRLTPVFTTQGLILYAHQHQGKLRWIYWEGGSFRRETGTPLLEGDLVPDLRWRIQADHTWLGYGQQLVAVGNPGAPQVTPQRQTVDNYGALPQFDCTDNGLCWLAQGYLWRQASPGPEMVGEVLAGQTQFWLGPTFGLGCYRAGQLQGAFVFDLQKPGLNDRVQLLPWSGQLLQASCCFSRGLAWLFLTTQKQGLRHYTCQVISAQGLVMATATSQQRENSWLTQLGASLAINHDPCPFCAVDDFLLAATDEGIVRIQLNQGQLSRTRTFAETEPFVDASCRLIAGDQGLWVVGDRKIDWLQLG